MHFFNISLGLQFVCFYDNIIYIKTRRYKAMDYLNKLYKFGELIKAYGA